MPKQEKILVVVDPAQEVHPALERAITNAKIRETGEKSDLALLITQAPPGDGKSGNSAFVCRNQQWVNSLQASLKNQDVDYDILFSWSAEWSKNILTLAKDLNADMVMLPLYDDQGGNHIISDEKWSLFRKCESPILLVRQGGAVKRKTILVTLKVQDSAYDELNQRVLERGLWAASRYGAELHVINAYSDSMNFPDRSKINRLAKIANEKIHIQQGEPDKVISEIADKIDADMILVGTKRRSGIKAALRGNTIEKIVGGVSQDVMLMV